MPDFNAVRSQLPGKTKEEVRALLGPPEATAKWDKPAQPREATPAQLRAFQDQTLDEIWAYRAGVVHFSLSGKALKTTENSRHYLPPQEGPPVA